MSTSAAHRKCVICQEPIGEQRLELSPGLKTCRSDACRAQLRRDTVRANVRRFRARKAAARTASPNR